MFFKIGDFFRYNCIIELSRQGRNMRFPAKLKCPSGYIFSISLLSKFSRIIAPRMVICRFMFYFFINQLVLPQFCRHSYATFLINDNKHQLVVLLAFPCGYLDPKVNFLIEKLRSFPKVHILLDMAQAYGCIELMPFILKSDVVYLSFNGNKLLNSGGAISLTFVNNQEKSYS